VLLSDEILALCRWHNGNHARIEEFVAHKATEYRVRGNLLGEILASSFCEANKSRQQSTEKSRLKARDPPVNKCRGSL
jgi:hypothetical protein